MKVCDITCKNTAKNAVFLFLCLCKQTKHTVGAMNEFVVCFVILIRFRMVYIIYCYMFWNIVYYFVILVELFHMDLGGDTSVHLCVLSEERVSRSPFFLFTVIILIISLCTLKLVDYVH